MVFGLILGAEQGGLRQLSRGCLAPVQSEQVAAVALGQIPAFPRRHRPGTWVHPPQVAIVIRFLFIFTAAYKPELRQGWLGNASLENENKKIISNPSKAARIETQKGKVKKIDICN